MRVLIRIRIKIYHLALWRGLRFCLRGVLLWHFLNDRRDHLFLARGGDKTSWFDTFRPTKQWVKISNLYYLTMWKIVTQPPLVLKNVLWLWRFGCDRIYGGADAVTDVGAGRLDGAAAVLGCATGLVGSTNFVIWQQKANIFPKTCRKIRKTVRRKVKSTMAQWSEMKRLCGKRSLPHNLNAVGLMGAWPSNLDM